ncbi:MAG TPA: VOC family protein [Prosthecobacter sp.]
MSSELAHIPAGYHSVTPSLTVKDGKAALEFYTKAFGAEERFRLTDPKTGGIAHAEFAIGDSALMLSDEYPEWNCVAPEIGQGGSFMIYVADVEESFLRAVNAGVTVITPPADQFYGDRSARLADSFGYRWTLAQRVREVPQEEMEKGMAECMGAQDKEPPAST